MERMNVLIVENVSLIAEGIASALTRNNIGVAGICETAEGAIAFLNKEIPDLILMDIKLSGEMDGITAMEIINKKTDIPFIYLTEHTDGETWERARKTQPSHYISKPFNEGDLVRAIEIAVYNWQTRDTEKSLSRRDFIFIKSEQSYNKVYYRDILYLQADRAYCKIVTEDRTYLQSSNMNSVFRQIKHEDFVRVHRSYVINVSRITEIEGNTIKLDKHEVRMSSDMRDELLNRLTFLK